MPFSIWAIKLSQAQVRSYRNYRATMRKVSAKGKTRGAGLGGVPTIPRIDDRARSCMRSMIDAMHTR